MNPIEPMLACGSMNLSPGAVAVILAVLGAWWLSGILAFVNLLLISFVKIHAQLKKAHFGGWVSYVVPGGVLLLGLYDLIPISGVPHVFWMIYLVAIPFITTIHFIYLLRIRRKLRVMARSAQIEDEY